MTDRRHHAVLKERFLAEGRRTRRGKPSGPQLRALEITDAANHLRNALKRHGMPTVMAKVAARAVHETAKAQDRGHPFVAMGSKDFAKLVGCARSTAWDHFETLVNCAVILADKSRGGRGYTRRWCVDYEGLTRWLRQHRVAARDEMFWKLRAVLTPVEKRPRSRASVPQPEGGKVPDKLSGKVSDKVSDVPSQAIEFP